MMNHDHFRVYIDTPMALLSHRSNENNKGTVSCKHSVSKSKCVVSLKPLADLDMQMLIPIFHFLSFYNCSQIKATGSSENGLLLYNSGCKTFLSGLL